MNLLVPMPVKPNLNPELLNKMHENLYRMTEQFGIDVAFNYDEFPKLYDGENFFARLARMRQKLVEEFLRPHHTDVLWIDADILEYPPLLPNMLRLRGSGVISPLVLIEGSDINYDTAGMRQSYEGRSMMDPPYFSGKGPLFDMESVGGCVLVPAEVHRQVAFEAQVDNEPGFVTEWWSVCQGAKAMGYTVQCTTDIVVRHADLPRYGEAFH